MSINGKGDATDFVWDLPSGNQVENVGRNVTVSQRMTSDTAELPTDEGETSGVVFFNDKEDVTIEAILPSSFTDPTIGGTVTFDQKTFAVMDFQKTWTRKDWAKVQITAHAWKGVSGVQGHMASVSKGNGSGSGSGSGT